MDENILAIYKRRRDTRTSSLGKLEFQLAHSLLQARVVGTQHAIPIDELPVRLEDLALLHLQIV